MRFSVSTRPRRRQKPNPNSNTRNHSKVTVERASEDPNVVVRTSLRTLVRESRTPPSRRPTEIELSPNALASQRSADAPLPVGEPLIFTRVCSRVSRVVSVCAFSNRRGYCTVRGARDRLCAVYATSIGEIKFFSTLSRKANVGRAMCAASSACESVADCGRQTPARQAVFNAFQKSRTLCFQSLSVDIEWPISAMWSCNIPQVLLDNALAAHSRRTRRRRRRGRRRGNTPSNHVHDDHGSDAHVRAKRFRARARSRCA